MSTGTFRAAAALLIACAALSAGSILRAQPDPQADGEGAPEKVPKCVHVRSEARYSGYGYDHLVEIDNRCTASANCTVFTDVNPQPQSVAVKAGEKQSISTFRGSPASAFKADVTCKLAS
jgi:hypothetical protein